MLDHIPHFPEFAPLTLSLKEPIEEFVNAFGPTGDYNFVSLWCYDVDESARVSKLHGSLILRFSDYLTGEPLYSFLGVNNVKETIDTLFSYQASMGLKQELKLLSERSVQEVLHDSAYTITEDRDNFDYILATDEIKLLQGKKFHTHRNHINTFKRLYPAYSVAVYRELTDEVYQHMKAVFDLWKKEKGESASEHEELAFSRLFQVLPQSQYIIVLLFVEDRPVAFSISDIHHHEMSQIHFAKADPSIRQAYYIMNQALAEELSKSGHGKINMENDLGIPGLRYAKEQWNPVEYIKKFTITPSL